MPIDPAGGAAQPLKLTAHEVASLGERIGALHDEVRRFAPAIERMACALYDPELDLLQTFVNSTRHGAPLAAYQYRLADSPSLSQIARSRTPRVIDDIPLELDGTSSHTRWLLEQGYRSSYTMPLFFHGALGGFLFFDSTRPRYFEASVTAHLAVYGRLVAMMIGHETTAVGSLVGTIRLAREFAHLRDVETGVHLERMSRFCRVIARALGPSHGLSDEFAERMFVFSPLHDIGKIGVPDAVLRKAGRHTPEERVQMQLHVAKGCEIVERLVRDFALEGLSGVTLLRNIVAGHHEMLDGSGYPHGWHAEQIPIEARIAAVADIFDALSSSRVYKRRWTVDETLARLDAMVADGKLDGACVDGLKAGLDEVLAIMKRFDEPGDGRPQRLR